MEVQLRILNSRFVIFYISFDKGDEIDQLYRKYFRVLKILKYKIEMIKIYFLFCFMLYQLIVNL